MPPVLKKTLLVFGVLVFAIFLFLLAVGIWGEDLRGYINERRQQAIYNKYITEPQKKLEEAYKKDMIGGKTPEETLRLFIAELKKGDLEAASKYYAVEDQKQTLVDLGEAQTRDNLVGLITYFNNILKDGKKVCGENVGVRFCGFELTALSKGTSTTTDVIGGKNYQYVIPNGTEVKSEEDLVLNPFSGLWKMTILK